MTTDAPQREAMDTIAAAKKVAEYLYRHLDWSALADAPRDLCVKIGREIATAAYPHILPPVSPDEATIERAKLIAALQRTRAALRELIHEHSDPGSESLAAEWEAGDVLARATLPAMPPPQVKAEASATRDALIKERQAGWCEALRAMRSVIDGWFAIAPEATETDVSDVEWKSADEALAKVPIFGGLPEHGKNAYRLAVSEVRSATRQAGRDEQHKADVKVMRKAAELAAGNNLPRSYDVLSEAADFLAANKRDPAEISNASAIAVSLRGSQGDS